MGEIGKVGQIIIGIARCIRRLAGPSIASLRGQELFNQVFKFPPRDVSYTVRDVTLRAKSYHINNSVAKKLGINPSLLTGGAEVLVVSKADFEKYCRAIGADAEDIAGVYAPKGRQEIQNVMTARKKALSLDVRRILVPEDADALTLCHEILHDLFLSWNLSRPHSERLAFIRLVFQEAYRALIFSPQSPEAEFFRAVAACCAMAFDLNSIISVPAPGVLIQQGWWLKEEAQIFVGEVFAYGAAMVIFSRMSAKRSEKNMGKVPEELKIYFERTIVHPELL